MCGSSFVYFFFLAWSSSMQNYPVYLWLFLNIQSTVTCFTVAFYRYYLGLYPSELAPSVPMYFWPSPVSSILRFPNIFTKSMSRTIALLFFSYLVSPELRTCETPSLFVSHPLTIVVSLKAKSTEWFLCECLPQSAFTVSFDHGSSPLML